MAPRWLLALALAALLSTASAQAHPIKHGNYHKTVQVGPLSRTYVVHVPQGYKDQKLPVVIVLHGGLGNELSARWDTKMSRKADSDQFFAVYPNGTGRSWTHLLTWNAGLCCGLGSSRDVDDVGFIRELIARMKIDFNVDADRIYVTGISNGGMLAYRVGRELGDIVAAVAPVAGCMFDFKGEIQSPVSVVVFHGTKDPIIPYDGGTGSVFGYKVHSQSVAAAIDYWVRNDHCSAVPAKQHSGNVTRETYSGGQDGTEVCLYTLTGGPHAWPGGRAAWPIWNKPSKELSATDAMCDFFWKHPKHHQPETSG